ncbi:Organic solute transporter alpha-like protein 1 [Toxocara canis]|uniref:Organic solute transporter alpha-like protein 1 n=1 Tax=Toxocara canis TaxID=6265 RepID=A0A0B2UYF9_TOXCA|nr:Organic solute transporter alpha-like protein 1 [Toxocara canis]
MELAQSTTEHSIHMPILNADVLAPTATEWLQKIPTQYLVFLIISTVVTAAVIVLAFIHLYKIHYYVHNESIQTDLYYLALLFPIVGLCSLLGMYMLRSAALLYVISHTYVMMCLLVLVTLLRNIFGGREKMSKYLLSHNELIKFNTPPLCCCCKCLPMFKPTERALRHVEWLTLQSPIVRIVAEIINMIAFFEESGNTQLAVITNVVEVLSMISALFGCNIIMNLGQEKQAPYRMKVVFQCVNLTQVFLTLQRFIFDMLGKFNVFTDTELLSSNTKAMYWNSMSLTLEMCLLSVVATILLVPHKTTFFDNASQRVQQIDDLPHKSFENPV